MKKQYDFYLASPFFNEEQVEREQFILKLLRDNGYKVFSPKENCFCPPNATVEDRQKVFSDNVNAIQLSKAVFAITDGKDMGTIWECGYAYGVGVPIIYFAETLGLNPFNLMLAQSGEAVFTSREQIACFAENGILALTLSSNDFSLPFEGSIE